jgi:hypothetical protein
MASNPRSSSPVPPPPPPPPPSAPALTPMTDQMRREIESKYVLSMKNVLKENVGYNLSVRPFRDFSDECTSIFTKIFLDNENGMIFVNYVYEMVSYELDRMMNIKEINLRGDELIHFVFKGGTNMFLVRNLVEQYVKTLVPTYHFEGLDDINKEFKVSDSDYSIYILTRDIERYSILNNIVKNNLSLILLQLKKEIQDFFPPNINLFEPSLPPSPGEGASASSAGQGASASTSKKFANYIILKKRNEAQNVLFWIIKYNLIYKLIHSNEDIQEADIQLVKLCLNLILDCIRPNKAFLYSSIIIGKILLILNLIHNHTGKISFLNKIYGEEEIELKNAFIHNISGIKNNFETKAKEQINQIKRRLIEKSFINYEKIRELKIQISKKLNEIKISQREEAGAGAGMNPENPLRFNLENPLSDQEVKQFLKNRKFFYKVDKPKKEVSGYQIGRVVTPNDIFIEKSDDILTLSSNNLKPLGSKTLNIKNDYFSYFSLNNNIRIEHPMVGFDTHFDLYRIKLRITLRNRVFHEEAQPLSQQVNNLLFKTSKKNSFIHFDELEEEEIQYERLPELKLNSELVDISIARYYDNVLVKLRNIFYGGDFGIEEYFEHYFMVSSKELGIRNMYIYNFESFLDDLNFTLYEKVFYEQLFDKKFKKRVIRHIFMSYFSKIFSYYYGREAKSGVGAGQTGVMAREHNLFKDQLLNFLTKLKDNINSLKVNSSHPIENIEFEHFFDIPVGFEKGLLFSVHYLKTQYGKRPYAFYKVKEEYESLTGFLNQITTYSILLMNFYQTQSQDNLREYFGVYNDIYNMYNVDIDTINNNFVDLLEVYIQNLRILYDYISNLIDLTASNIMGNGITYGGVITGKPSFKSPEYKKKTKNEKLERRRLEHHALHKTPTQKNLKRHSKNGFQLFDRSKMKYSKGVLPRTPRTPMTPTNPIMNPLKGVLPRRMNEEFDEEHPELTRSMSEHRTPMTPTNPIMNPRSIVRGNLNPLKNMNEEVITTPPSVLAPPNRPKTYKLGWSLPIDSISSNIDFVFYTNVHSERNRLLMNEENKEKAMIEISELSTFYFNGFDDSEGEEDEQMENEEEEEDEEEEEEEEEGERMGEEE